MTTGGKIVATIAVLGAIGAATSENEASPKKPAVPEVTGLALPEAKSVLLAKGYRTSVKAENAMFGVIVEQNFTVCDQDDPRGKLVPLDVSKEC
jgi:beta-lactam-binding protein with PASTA domain